MSFIIGEGQNLLVPESVCADPHASHSVQPFTPLLFKRTLSAILSLTANTLEHLAFSPNERLEDTRQTKAIWAKRWCMICSQVEGYELRRKVTRDRLAQIAFVCRVSSSLSFGPYLYVA
jgi:hypothetical protein